MTTSAGMGSIRGRYGNFRGAGVESTKAFTVGRGSDNDLVLTAPEVSKRHAQLTPESDGSWRLIDLSSNGTQVDGVPVDGSCILGEVAVLDFGGAGELIFQQVHAGARRGPLNDSGDTVRPVDQTLVEQDPGFLADALGRLGVAEGTSPDRTAVGGEAPALPGALGGPPPAAASEVPPAAATPESASEGGPPPAAPAASGSELAWWLVFEGEPPLEFELTRGSHTLGRGSTVSLRVLHEHLSREHARVEVGDLVALEDLGSSNHTFVEGRRIEGRVELEDGALVAFGDLRARLVRRASS